MPEDTNVATLSEIIEQNKPVGGEFAVTFGLGKRLTLKFALPQTYTGWARFKRERSEWVASQSHLSPIAELQHLWPRDEAALEAVYTINELSTSPKLSLADAIRMLEAPALVDAILTHLEIHRSQAVAQKFHERVQLSKNDLKEIRAGESGSPSAETHLGDTLSN